MQSDNATEPQAILPVAARKSACGTHTPLGTPAFLATIAITSTATKSPARSPPSNFVPAVAAARLERRRFRDGGAGYVRGSGVKRTGG